jgi:hypothetical protein
MVRFGKERFDKNYQNLVGMKARSMLHQNSKELVSVLQENDVIFDGMNIFELGSGPARNLKYINDVNGSVNLYCNDLWKSSSMKNMCETIKDKINFYEMDSLSFVKNFDFSFHMDLFISSDHLMHISYEDADEIIKSIRDFCKPSYILLREVRKKNETPNHPRLFHDYNQLLDSYNLIHERISNQTDAYFIMLLKRKN